MKIMFVELECASNVAFIIVVGTMAKKLYCLFPCRVASFSSATTSGCLRWSVKSCGSAPRARSTHWKVAWISIAELLKRSSCSDEQS